VDLATQLAQLAHDIRAPVTTMQTAIELLDEDLARLDPSQIRHVVSALHRSTLWLQQLVDTLPQEAPNGDPDGGRRRAPVNLRATLDGIVPIIEPMLAAQRQHLAVEGPERLPAVFADPQQLGRVYVNLLTNASKFAPTGTPIVVGFTPEDGCIRVAIEDRGPGIPSEALPHLFEPYYQAPTVAAKPGHGLGLAIVQSIIAAHGGQVGAENRRCGGARVWFTLPRAG
jgi:signal transduction histidine kinase